MCLVVRQRDSECSRHYWTYLPVFVTFSDTPAFFLDRFLNPIDHSEHLFKPHRLHWDMAGPNWSGANITIISVECRSTLANEAGVNSSVREQFECLLREALAKLRNRPCGLTDRLQACLHALYGSFEQWTDTVCPLIVVGDHWHVFKTVRHCAPAGQA